MRQAKAVPHASPVLLALPSLPASPSKDPAVIVARAELALGAERFTEPPGDNLADYLQLLAMIEPENGAIARLRGKATETLLAKDTQELADKYAHEAADHLRKRLAVAPDKRTRSPRSRRRC